MNLDPVDEFFLLGEGGLNTLLMGFLEAFHVRIATWTDHNGEKSKLNTSNQIDGAQMPTHKPPCERAYHR